MKDSIFYSTFIHLFFFSLLIFSKNIQLSRPKQYYIDFIGENRVTTPQNSIASTQISNDNIKNERKSEEKSKTKEKTQNKVLKQLEDPDYLYTNSKIKKPSLLDEESQILKNNSSDAAENNSSSGTSAIVTDSDFPYPWYITKLRTKLWENWQARDITSKNLRATVRFRILKDGNITSVRIDSSSGNRLFDQSVISTVIEIKKFEPLPGDFKEDFLTIYVEFKTGD